jgi:hypothetical protein
VDVVEKGKGAQMALLLLNKFRSIKEMEPVGLSAVNRTMKRPRPVIRKVRKGKQGSKDASCPWAKARPGWTTQLLVRIGNHTFNPDEECNKHLALSNAPHCYDAMKLPELSIYQIAFWDEVHKEQVVGVNGDFTYAFPRDEDGAYTEDGMVAEQATRLHMKYSEQGRFCCGVASVMKDGT